MAIGLAESFGPAAHAVVAATPAAQVLRQDIWVAPRMRRLIAGRAVLVGDAAHAMCPNLGRGACESIIDAVVLGQALNAMRPADALRHYGRSRSRRTRRIQRASRLVLALSTIRRGAGLRNAVLRLGPGRADRQPVVV